MKTMMTRAEITAKVIEIAAEQGGVDAATVTVDTHLFNDLTYDSLDAVEFMMKLEDAFEIAIPDQQAEEVKTVGQAVDLLVRFFDGGSLAMVG